MREFRIATRYATSYNREASFGWACGGKTQMGMKKKVLIFIVTYNAQRTIERVLSRIPAEVFANDEYEASVLIIDDCSQDQTFERGHHFKAAHQTIPLTVLRNPVNLGYGGNQKVGYHFAISGGFDVVALLHGDGQYAPEELPKLLRPLVAGECDAVFGSRMMTRGEALRGGMPRYKYVGNKILTFLQNKIAGATLSEWHSGYRLYSVAALKTIPFEKNSNGFDFDTDIILQLLFARCSIKELPIPTFYGDEICHVNGLQYAAKIIATCLQAKLQRFGLFYDPKLEASGEASISRYSFLSPYSAVLEQIRAGERILLLDWPKGESFEPFLDKGCRLTLAGTDIEHAQSRPGLELRPLDLDAADVTLELEGPFDAVLLIDTLEHRRSPEALLRAIRSYEGCRGATVYISTPNIAFFTMRLMLLLGFFNYGKRGILDKTHRRLFTVGSLKRLLGQEGFKIKALHGLPAPFPLALGAGRAAEMLLSINRLLVRVAPRLFAFQLLCLAEPAPTAAQLLRAAARHSEEALADIEAAPR